MLSGSVVDLRIDNNTFESLYHGKGFDDHNVPGVHKKQAAQAPRSTQDYVAKKKVPEGWADIKRAKDGVKYDDIPDPYSQSTKPREDPQEEGKSSKKLESLGRSQKSNTVVKKAQNSDFFGGGDDFDWVDNGAKNKPKANDAFGFEFEEPKATKSKSSAFDFDGFGKDLPKEDKKQVFDPFSDNSSSASTGLEGILFDNSVATKPKTTDLNDIFKNNILEPQSNNKSIDTNPFHAFSEVPVKKENPFISGDVFGQNNAFPSAFDNNVWGGGFSNSTGGGVNQATAFNSGFTSQFGGLKAAQPAPKNEFAFLNPFGESEKPKAAKLPHGVDSSDLFS